MRVEGRGLRVEGLKLRAVLIGRVLNLRATTSQKREAVPRRART